jgi:RNA polymerase sigma-70 factor (ECF subfamily)
VEDLNEPDRLRWERALVGRAKGGDQAAFAELYRVYAPLLFARVLVPKLGNREAAEDALSETFRPAFERLESFEPREVSLYFWLARIAANKAIDLHRAKRTTGRALSGFEDLAAAIADHPPNPGELFEMRADVMEIRAAVQVVLGRLNDRYRRAIELRFVEDLTREDCSRALDVKIGTFDVLLLRALRAFQKTWSELRGSENPKEPDDS